MRISNDFLTFVRREYNDVYEEVLAEDRLIAVRNRVLTTSSEMRFLCASFEKGLVDWSGFLGRDIRISVYKYGALQDGESPYTIIVARHDQPHTDHTHENKLKYLHKIRVKRYERTIDFTEDEKYHIDRAFTRGFGERKRQVCNETPYARFPATSVVYED